MEGGWWMWRKGGCGERIDVEGECGGRVVDVMTFTPEKSQQSVRQEEKEKEHRRERLAVRRFVLTVLLSDPISPFVLFRSAKALKKDRVAPKFWLGKRVK